MLVMNIANMAVSFISMSVSILVVDYEDDARI